MAKTKTRSVSEVMTPNPVMIKADSPVTDAARAMRDSDIGDVIVVENGDLWGIVTDRDIVIRAIATGMNPSTTTLREICSKDVTTIDPRSPVDDAMKLMRARAIRRLPVVDGGHPVGVLSLGDLAIERDPKSALADISESPPNS